VSTPDELPDDATEVVLRVNVALVRAGADALHALRDRTGLKKVDIVNRALQVYEFVDAEMRAGKDLLVRAPNGDIERVKIL
jgi:hypothetical protein